MNIEQLINDKCPNGVEWKTVGTTCKIERGKVYSKEYLREHAGEYPVYSSQTLNNGELGKIDTYNYEGEYLTRTTDGAKAGTVFRRNGKFSITNVCGIIKIENPNLTLDFLYYWLSIEAKKHVSPGMGNPKLMSNVMEKIGVPIPPIEVQRKIVEILDKFTEIEANLEVDLKAELKAREQQYTYYRNKLFTLSAEKDITWKKLEDVCDILDSLRRPVSKAERESGEIPYYGANGIQDYVKDYIFDGTFLLVGEDGSVINKDNSPVLNWAVGKIWVNNHAHVLQERNDVALLKFLYYYLQTVDVSNLVRGVPPKLNQQNLRNIEVPIPSLEQQEAIVSILEHFEKKINDVIEELSTEASLRHKQYEYYRDRLLTFNEA